MNERSDSLGRVRQCLEDLERRVEEVDAIASEIVVALRSGTTLFIAGRGRLSSVARMMAAEYVSRHGETRSRGLAAIALAGDPASAEVVQSDFGEAQLPARILESIAAHGDLLLLLVEDASDASLKRTARVARQAGVAVIGIAVSEGGAVFEPGETVLELKLERSGDGSAVLLAVHSHIISRVEEALGVLD